MFNLMFDSIHIVSLGFFSKKNTACDQLEEKAAERSVHLRFSLNTPISSYDFSLELMDSTTSR